MAAGRATFIPDREADCMDQARMFSGVLTLLLVSGLSTALSDATADTGTQAARRDVSGDPLPEGALARLGSTRLRHLGRVLALDYSPKGKLIASGGEDGTVRLWDERSGKEVHRWEVEGGTKAVRFSPDGRLVACGVGGVHRVTRLGETGEYHVHVWKVSSKKEVRRLGGLRSRITSVAFSSDGKKIAAGAGVFMERGEVRIWDLRSGKEMESLRRLPRGVAGVDISPDGTLLAGALLDNTVRIWSLPGAKEVKTLGEAIPHGGANAVAFSPNGKLLASDVWGSGIQVWDTSSWTEVHNLKDPRGTGSSLDFSRDGRTLASGGLTGKAILWDVESGEILQSFMRPEDEYRGQFNCSRPVALSPDGKRLAAGHQDSKILVWDLETGEEVMQHPGHEGAVFDVAFSPDGKRLYSGGRDATIRIWDVRKGEPIQRVADPGSPVLSLSLSPDGQTLVTGDDRENVALWATDGGESLSIWPLRDWEKLRRESPGGVSYFARPALSVEFSAAGDRVLVAAGDDHVLLIDPDSGEIEPLIAPEGRPSHLEWSQKADIPRLLQAFVDVGPDRSGAFFIPGTDSVIYRGGPSLVLARDLTFQKEWLSYELNPGKPKGPAFFQGPEPRSMAVSPDGQIAALGTTAGTIRLLELCTGKVIRTWKAHSPFITCLTFSPDGRTLASSGMDETIRVWSVSTGKEILERSGREGWACSLAYSPDGKTLASAGLDNTVLLWSLEGMAPSPPRSPRALADKERDEIWEALGGADTAKASNGIWRLEESPALALRLIEERSAATGPVDTGTIETLIGGLDATDFQERERATRELQDLGAAAEPALRKKLESPDGPAETRIRIKEILAASLPPLDHPPHDALRGIRCVRLLGLVGTREAAKVLESIAKTHPSSFVRARAESAAGRIRSAGSPGEY